MAKPAAQENWLDILRTAKKTCLIQDGRRKVHCTLADGTELVEEYDARSNLLVVRKWRQKGKLGGQKNWEYEIGEQLAPPNVEISSLRESAANPVFVRCDTADAFQWRIRNLPYPLDIYDVSVDTENRVIIIRTTNKKYYKKYNIPDMDRAQLPLAPESLSIAHANNTLIVTYKKPAEILQMEKELLQEFKKMKANNDGDVECAQS